MTKTELIKNLEAAINAAPAPAFGEWKVHPREDSVLLVWTCDADRRPEMYGDEPWADWGGNAIMEAAGAPSFADSGSDAYVDRFGDDVVSQWVEWNEFADDEA